MTREYARAERRKIIAALHADGLTNAQIAKRLGMSENPVASYVTKLGLIPHAKPKRDPRASIVAATPWDATPGTPRPETAPRGSHMVSSRAGTMAADLAIAAIRQAHRKHVGVEA